MPRSSKPSRHDDSSISITEARGKVFDSIKVYPMDEAVNIALNFADDTSLEIVMNIGFTYSANLIKFEEGNSVVLKRIKTNVPSKRN